MKILFQGGWKAGRDEGKKEIDLYGRAFAKYAVTNNHQIVLAYFRNHEKVIADEIAKVATEQGKDVKKHLLFLLPDTEKEIPTIGRVKKYSKKKWYSQQRTYLIQSVDAVLTIGGGKGTYDSIERAILSDKPVFVTGFIPGKIKSLWSNHADYHYFEEGDADFLTDLNSNPDEFFTNVFEILETYNDVRYSRDIFIVHGRDHEYKNSFVSLLEKLGFRPIVLQDEPSQSLTIIEKLERDMAKIGFGFVLYTPDDFGRLEGESEQPRARQNVVFEHGYLLGSLGRSRTCAILKGMLEIPSDIQGMVYTQINDFATEHSKITRILQEAGYKCNT